MCLANLIKQSNPDITPSQWSATNEGQPQTFEQEPLKRKENAHQRAYLSSIDYTFATSAVECATAEDAINYTQRHHSTPIAPFKNLASSKTLGLIDAIIPANEARLSLLSAVRQEIVKV